VSSPTDIAAIASGMNAEVFGMLHGEFVGNPASIIERLCPRPRGFVGNTLLVWIDSINTVVRILGIHTLVHRYPFVVGAVPRLLDSTHTLKRNTSTYLIPRASKRASGSGQARHPELANVDGDPHTRPFRQGSLVPIVKRMGEGLEGNCL